MLPVRFQLLFSVLLALVLGGYVALTWLLGFVWAGWNRPLSENLAMLVGCMFFGAAWISLLLQQIKGVRLATNCIGMVVISAIAWSLVRGKLLPIEPNLGDLVIGVVLLLLVNFPPSVRRP